MAQYNSIICTGEQSKNITVAGKCIASDTTSDVSKQMCFALI